MIIRNFLDSIQHIYPFHIPGHKRNVVFSGAYAKADITEIHGADNLLKPEGIILSLQKKLATQYGADESFILVNGSTVGIESAILHLGAAQMIMARNSHCSAYSGLILSGGVPAYIYPEITTEGIAGIITPETVELALATAPDAAAVFITSPTFEGYCSDIARIAEIVHKSGKLLIVDEAHGAHFGFHPAFPKNASRLGADIVIQSLHKTLPVPGQCSVMHVIKKRVDTKKLKDCVNVLQTSSPSYFFITEIERCVELLRGDGTRLFEAYYARLSRFRREMEGIKNIVLLPETEELRLDPGKLTFYMNGGLNGVEFGRSLRERGIELEMCLTNHAVAMTSIADTDEGFERLAVAVREIDKGEAKCKARKRYSRFASQAQVPFPCFTLREAFFSSQRAIALKDAEGMIAGSFIIPYPPGVPLVAPGETVTGEMIREVEMMLATGADVLGADKISVIEK